MNHYFIVILFALFSTHGWAQEDVSDVDVAVDDEAAEEVATEEVEKIEVTGSRIKRVDIETVKNIVTLDRESIDQSGVSTVGDLLKDQTLSSFGSQSTPEVNSNTGTYIDVRGIGADKTLVLLDGRRLPISGDNRFDVSKIPVGAIERIDILPDSASAIYGADAIGGVVNIITRRNFDGSAISVRSEQTGYEGQNTTSYNFVTGGTTAKSDYMIFLGYRESEPFYYRNAPWAYDGTSLSVYSWPANYYDANGDFQSPGVDSGGCTDYSNTSVVDGVCRYDYGQTMQIGQDIKELSFMANFQSEVTETINLFGHARANQRSLVYNMAPAAFYFLLPYDGTDASVFTYLGIPDPGGDIEITMRGVPWGNREWDLKTNEFASTIGLQGIIGADYDWEVSFSSAQEQSLTLTTGGRFFKDDLVEAIRAETFNPFDPSSSDLSFADSSAANPWYEETSKTEMMSFVLSGALGEMNDAPIGFGLGLDWQNWKYEDALSAQAAAANIAGFNEEFDNTSGTRYLTAFWAESIMNVLSRTELRLAARYDSFSDFDSAVSPLVQITHRFSDKLMWKIHGGQGFAAPSMSDKYGGQFSTVFDVYDTSQCRALYGVDRTDQEGCQYTELRTVVQANEQLNAETSTNWSTGFVSQLTDDWDLSATYWYLEQKDVISANPQYLLDGIADGQTYDGVVVDRRDNGQLRQLTVPKQNIGVQQDSGIDIKSNYNFRSGRFNYGVNFSYSQRELRRIKFADDFVNYLGTSGFPKSRYNLGFQMGFGDHVVNATYITIGEHERVDKNGNVPSWSYLNLQYQLQMANYGRLTVGARNLFDESFPLDKSSSNRGDDQRIATLYPPYGRVIFAEYNLTF